MPYDPSRVWTDAEIHSLRVYYPIHGADWEGWAEVLEGRTKKAIQRKAGLLDIFHKDMRKSPERKRPEHVHREAEHRSYDFQPMPDPYEGLILRLLHEGKTLREIDKRMHWHPNRAKQILTERWKRLRDAPRKTTIDSPKRFPAYTVDIDGLIRKYCSWSAWKNHALKAEGEERVYRKALGETFEVYETFR